MKHMEPEQLADELHILEAAEIRPDPPFARGGVRDSPCPRTVSPPYEGGWKVGVLTLARIPLER